MTGPQPPEEPYSPEFRVPPMTPVQPGGFDDPADRKRRMRMGILGAAVGVGIPVIITIVAFALGYSSGATGSDQMLGAQILLLAGLVVASPIEIIAGIVLAAVQRTRPFGVGFLIGSAVGLLIMAGACFVPLAVANA